ncbi:MAG: carbohydrate ABC transporter permease [bacterium]|nr:carbohydrate ABC transporter permease [bacterium]
MDRKRPFWRSSVLHLVLVSGALVFALPYAWLLGTSWKLEKEVQSAEVRIFPQRPIPEAVSPYVDRREYAEIVKPEQVSRARWSEWMRTVVEERVGRRIDAWSDPRTADLPAGVVRTELLEGIFARLKNLVPYATWETADEAAFRAAVDAVLGDEMPAECFEQAYRYFGLGKVKVKTLDYKIHDLTGDRPIAEVWTVESGPVDLVQGIEAERPVALGGYDFGKGDAFELSARFEVPFELADTDTGFKRLDLSFRSDQTWHEMRVWFEMNGKLYRALEPKYLAIDRWWEAQYQFPSADDQRLAPKRYVLLEEVGSGIQFDHGPRAFKLRVRLEKSSRLEAYWAKATENYRTALDEVPFWRYFKTSVFLVIANIMGTLLSCSLAAYAFARLKWPGRDLCFMLVLATLMIPPQITMIPSFVIYRYLGWYNSLAPLWVPNCLAVNAFAIFLLRQAMKGVPRDLEEAAMLDGCGYLRIYWNVVLPLMRPTMAAIAIFTFMFVWNDFMTPLIYVNDQRLYPLALGLFSFMAGRENQFTLIMAGSMIMTLPVILTFFFAQRHFIQGVTMTGMKN